MKSLKVISELERVIGQLEAQKNSLGFFNNKVNFGKHNFDDLIEFMSEVKDEIIKIEKEYTFREINPYCGLVGLGGIANVLTQQSNLFTPMDKVTDLVSFEITAKDIKGRVKTVIQPKCENLTFDLFIHNKKEINNAIKK